MVNQKTELLAAQQAQAPGREAEEKTTLAGYRAPQLRQVGSLELMQGRNYYSDKDAGNSNYYI